MFSVSAMTLLVELQEGHLASKNLCLLSRKVLFQMKWMKKADEELTNASSLENSR